MKYKDFMGKAIQVGDTIVYPVRRGSDLHLKSGVVLELTETWTISDYDLACPALRIKTKRKHGDPSKIETTKMVEAIFTSLHRCVVVE